MVGTLNPGETSFDWLHDMFGGTMYTGEGGSGETDTEGSNLPGGTPETTSGSGEAGYKPVSKTSGLLWLAVIGLTVVVMGKK